MTLPLDLMWSTKTVTKSLKFREITPEISVIVGNQGPSSLINQRDKFDIVHAGCSTFVLVLFTDLQS